APFLTILVIFCFQGCDTQDTAEVTACFAVKYPFFLDSNFRYRAGIKAGAGYAVFYHFVDIVGICQSDGIILTNGLCLDLSGCFRRSKTVISKSGNLTGIYSAEQNVYEYF